MKDNELWVKMLGAAFGVVLVLTMMALITIQALLEWPAKGYLRAVTWLIGWPISLLFAAVNFCMGHGWEYRAPDKVAEHLAGKYSSE